MIPPNDIATPNKPGSASLFLQTKLLDKRVIVTLIVRLKIAEMIATISDHLEKAPAGMKILRILLEMLRKLVDLTRKKRDLHIRRAGVSIVPSGIFDNRRLFLSGKHGTPTLPRLA